MKFITVFILIFTLNPYLWAQNKTTTDQDLIQISGVVLNSSNLNPIAFSNILIKGSFRGTISDFYGFYSLVGQKGDTLEFSALGYKKMQYVIPDSLEVNRYSLIQMLHEDTIQLKEFVVYPWPSLEQFKQAFINQNPDTDLRIALQNLSPAELAIRREYIAMDGNENFKYQLQAYQSKLYAAVMLPQNNLLNPIAWAKFIESWRKGELKRE